MNLKNVPYTSPVHHLSTAAHAVKAATAFSTDALSKERKAVRTEPNKHPVPVILDNTEVPLWFRLFRYHRRSHLFFQLGQ
ncbi:hypothetical protein [Pontibacillus yanchengensis]|uniref:hypothetical protein n=1 Tax=Pontibacillus yanchengensis TaxID=462910 RepID=UPI001F22ECD3|nr:hypothetical protein [Pontibacillus yanchengensis]